MKSAIFVFILFSTIGASAQFSSATLNAAGLTCAMCAKAIYRSLEKLPGIKSVDADIKQSAFIIGFKDGADIDPDALKAAVVNAGFSVASLTLTGNFKPIEVANDAHIQLGGRTFHFLGVNKETLQGVKTLKMVDKDYVSGKTFKKYVASTAMACVKTGSSDNCCKKGSKAIQTRIYHVTI